MVENIELVSVTKNDLKFGYDLYLLTQKEYLDKIWSAETEKEYFENYEQNIKNIENNYIIKYSGKNIGWLEYTEKENLFNIIQLHILPEYQRKGIGTKIINDIIKEAKIKNKDICLNILINNIKAKELFLKLGFEIYDETCYFCILEYNVKNN